MILRLSSRNELTQQDAIAGCCNPPDDRKADDEQQPHNCKRERGLQGAMEAIGEHSSLAIVGRVAHLDRFSRIQLVEYFLMEFPSAAAGITTGNDIVGKISASNPLVIGNFHLISGTFAVGIGFESARRDLDRLRRPPCRLLGAFNGIHDVSEYRKTDQVENVDKNYKKKTFRHACYW
jgi:hypothetical protein